MNPEAQAELDRIKQIDPNAMTGSEKAFLRARSSYLTSAEQKDFASVLTDGQPQAALVAYEDMLYQDLKDRAAGLGIDFPGSIKKADLIQLIRDVEAENAQ